MKYSYDFQNLVRDLSNEFDAIRRSAPVFISLLGLGAPATHTKHEWLEDKLQAQTDAINNGLGYGTSDTSIVVDDGTKFAAGMIVAIDGSDEVMKVTAVSTNTLTVTRGFGGSTAEAIVDNAVVRIIANPKLQGTDPGDDSQQEPSVEYNYTQILDRTAKVSRTGEAVKKYGIGSALDYQVAVHMDQLMRDLNNSAIYGRRVAPAASTPGVMGGILQYLNGSGGNASSAAGAALSATLLNNAIESAWSDGGRPTVLLCNTYQARKITQLNSSTSNYTVMQDSKVAGNQVIKFVSDLPGGVITDIVVDPNFPTDAVAILDVSRIKLVPLDGGAFKDGDARIPGGDYFARRILGEYTLEIKNALHAHALIKNLATS